MDDDALTSSRQVARLRHALEESQGALKEAQAALGEVGRGREEGQDLAGKSTLCSVTESSRYCLGQCPHHVPCLPTHTVPSTVPSWQERKRCVESQSSGQAQAARAAEAAKRCDRLAAEVAGLQVALEQKQELITALQVTVVLTLLTRKARKLPCNMMACYLSTEI